MKKITNYLLVLLTVLFMGTFASCTETEDDVTGLTSEQIAQYSNDIVGKWKVNGTQEYWRFESSGYGENWDQGDGIYEGEDGTYKFKWYIKPSGLYIIIKIQGEYGNPDTDCPYTILSLTSTTLSWKSNDGYQKTMTRQ